MPPDGGSACVQVMDLHTRPAHCELWAADYEAALMVCGVAGRHPAFLIAVNLRCLQMSAGATLTQRCH